MSNVEQAFNLNWVGVGGRMLCVGRLYVGQVDKLDVRGREDIPWRAWLMTSDDGESVGWFETEDQARDALARAAFEAVLAK